jgi:RNA polymerase sigma factor (sigma-70 family)
MEAATAVNATLIESARLGEPVALVELLQRSQPELRRYAQRSCIVSDVDDAVQETLLIISRSIHGLNRPRAWSGWVFRIVRRECHRLARVTLRQDLWDDDAVDALVSRRTESELRLDVAAALESLPETYREVVVLRDFEGLTIGEMAQRLGITVLAVKGRLHRARELTREYLLR